MRIKFVYTAVVMFFVLSVFSQADKSFEAAIHLGVASFQTDYGQRGDFKSGVTGNLGFGFGASVYMNFFDRNIEWNSKAPWAAQHVKLKAELSYLKANLEHNLDTTNEIIGAMHGTASIVNFGLVTEYHFLDLTNFATQNSLFSPFIGVGAMLNYSSPTFETSLGDYTTNSNLLAPKYQNDAIFIEPETTFSVLMAFGTRIKVGYNADIVLDSRWQYFTSNQIDALDPKHESNKFNDWMYNLNIGYIFYFN